MRLGWPQCSVLFFYNPRMNCLNLCRRPWVLMGLWAVLVSAGLLSGCATPAPPAQPVGLAASPWALASSQRAGQQPWEHREFPGKAATVYNYQNLEGRHAMAVQADASASMLRQVVNIAPAELGAFKFSWKVADLLAQADMARRDADDSPVRIVLAFEGDRSQFSAKNSMLSELSLLLTGEPLPYATLMYVWCNTRAPGTVIVNPRTDRIRKLVVETGAQHLNQWLDYERNIRADFEKAFGEAPGALVGIGIMTDSDNTQAHTRAWYGPLQLAKLPP